jgi:DnaK suppressor protein
MANGLTPEQLAGLKQQLLRQLDEGVEEVRQELLRSDNEQYIELAGRVHDVGEESVADLLADVNLAVIDLHINRIRDIDAALLRIAGDTYGMCSDCDGDIGQERLRVYPTAKRCHDCQERYEQRSMKVPPSL